MYWQLTVLGSPFAGLDIQAVRTSWLFNMLQWKMPEVLLKCKRLKCFFIAAIVQTLELKLGKAKLDLKYWDDNSDKVKALCLG